MDDTARFIRRSPTGRISAEADLVSEDVRKALGRDLSAVVRGEVRFDTGSRALYATDASNYRQVPLGVVVPRTVDDVVAAVGCARNHHVPLVMRGGGTSLAGQGCNVALLIDFSKYLHNVVSLDAERRLATVEPGCILDTLRDAAEKHNLTFGPDPATHDHNTLGGMLGNNSCGVHSIMAGRTSDNVQSLDILTYDGLRMTVGPTSDADLRAYRGTGGRRAEIYRALDEFRARYGDMIRARYPKIPRRVSGYENLDDLLPENGFNVARALVGTECSCVVILNATLNLVHSPPHRELAVLGYDDIFRAADAVPEVLQFGPIGLEAIDDLLIKFVRLKHMSYRPGELPPGNGWLVVEFGGETPEEALHKANRLVDAFRRKGGSGEVLRTKQQQAELWSLREAALGATAHVPGYPEGAPGWEDSAVPRDKLGNYLRELKALFRQHGYVASVYGHFGDGLVHCRVPFNLRTEAGLVDWQHFLDEAADLVVRYGGSLSGEHGDGQARAALLEKMYGADLIEAFREFKAIWDPRGMMNPGKVVDPYPITSNLRIGPLYQPPEVDHHFAFEEDGGSFTGATRRCVGVGSCRRTDSDKSVMCPSYMATREEKYSTRGRARLLFEMLHGGVLETGWNNPEVEESLDLCLACKGCKSDCPVNVDMATYKAEFRSHYYERRLRPRSAYTMGLIHRWSRLASAAPSLANAAMRAPIIAPAIKWAAGIAQQRTIPAYAPEPFTQWFRRHPRPNGKSRRVLLWPDTFNNYFRTETAMAATRLLERLGFEVTIPRTNLCCGRPLYDWGMLDSAKALWRQTLDTLLPEIEAGVPVVGLEPACVSAFRDELLGLFHGDERADQLAKNTFLLTEFIAREGRDLSRAHLSGKALVQVHCHHYAVMKADPAIGLLDQLGLDTEVMKSGCCGMAGSFGFEAEKYDISIAAAERVLLPRVRAAASDTLIVANGFSCREQIEQGTGRRTLHYADLLDRALAHPS
jgi:FAD/FMN-containing dehydrogenase/Fe-S oxidoreductase